ncbi:unnamed protein product, partial [Rhizoctonia solani]
MAGPSRVRSPAPAAFPSFARAMSPAVFGTAIGAHQDTSHALVGPSALAKSWTEVLDCVPSAYKEALRASFKDLHSRAVKFHACEAALEKLKKGQHDARPPPQVQGVHEPRWQVAKEFAESTEGLTALREITEAHEAYTTAVWSRGVELKKAELAYHTQRLTTESWWPPILAIIDDVYRKMDRDAPVIQQEASEEAELVIGYQESSSLALEHKNVRSAVPDLCLRILALEKAKVLGEANKLKAKVQLKETADVEMADGTKTDSKLVQQMVQAEVRKFLT